MARKYYESSYYLRAIQRGEHKRKKFVYILEHARSNIVMRKLVRNRLTSRLPLLLQQQAGLQKNMIDSVEVLSIVEWNEKYVRFPLKLIEGNL